MKLGRSRRKRCGAPRLDAVPNGEGQTRKGVVGRTRRGSGVRSMRGAAVATIQAAVLCSNASARISFAWLRCQCVRYQRPQRRHVRSSGDCCMTPRFVDHRMKEPLGAVPAWARRGCALIFIVPMTGDMDDPRTEFTLHLLKGGTDAADEQPLSVWARRSRYCGNPLVTIWPGSHPPLINGSVQRL